jgi:CheY-like chemotaxis protein
MTGSSAAASDCVLVVDDEEDIRATLVELVEMGGCPVLAASNGAEALQILLEKRPCLMILDLLMPVMNGTELLEEMKKNPALASVQVVISTSAPNRAPAGIPIVPKPIDINLIWDWMRRTCNCASDIKLEVQR